MSSFSKLLSHPETSLVSHLGQVTERMRAFVEAKVDDPKLISEARLIGLAHDFGKSTSYFQSYIDPEREYKKTELKNHASLSACFCFHLLKHCETLRSEPRLWLIGWYLVQRHHGSLTDLTRSAGGEIKIKGAPKHRELLKKQVADIEIHTLSAIERAYKDLGVEPHINEFIQSVKTDEIIKEVDATHLLSFAGREGMEFYLKLLFLWSALLDADRMTAGGAEVPPRESIPSEMIPSYKKLKFGEPQKEIDRWRKQGAEEVLRALKHCGEEHRFSITLPTGLGKTLTALQAGFALREASDKPKPRIIYALPYLSIIEQNYTVLEDVLETMNQELKPEVLLKHHHLSSGYFDPNEEEALDPQKALLLTEGWHSEVVVTTFCQLIESLITNIGSRARKVHNITKSILILDEVQAIPRKYWGLIKEVLTLLTERYGCYLILMTATNPLIFTPGEEIRELVGEKEKFYEVCDRVQFTFDLKERELSSFCSEALEEVRSQPDKDFMFVLNTIASAKELYQFLSKKLADSFLDLIYLSTHILPLERLSRIKTIQDSDQRKIVVTTQLVEAGVDIDLDRVVRDFAPLDSIIQAAGRCNRENSQDMGKMKVVKLKDEETGRLFSSYIYDRWLLEATEEVLADYIDQPISEAQFSLEAANAYFQKVKSRGAEEETVYQSMTTLKFSNVKLRLIEENLKRYSIFVEVDDAARKLKEAVESIMESKAGYRRNAELLAYKRDFYQHILTVRVSPKDLGKLNSLPYFAEREDFRVISGPDRMRWYDPDTGFSIPESTVGSQII